jgi:phospholipase C
MKKVTRRTAIKQMGAAAGLMAAVPKLLGCDGSKSAGRISTLVVLCMENRTYDHFMGARSLLEGKPGDGLTEGMMNLNNAGEAVPIFHADVPCIYDPPHSWGPSRLQWNAGANDGFVKAYEDGGAPDPRQVMGYWTRAELPIHYAIADAYTSFDRWFASLMGPTWPNREYLWSASSNGVSGNDLPTTAGGFTWPSFMGHLGDAGVEWKSYFASLALGSLYADAEPYVNRFRPMAAFFDDAMEGSLPPFCMIEPQFYYNDDHPPTHPVLGQQLIASIYAGLAASPQWQECLFVVTYDEHGGFFDHVSPPKTQDDFAADGFDQLGFRVPALAMGPYVKEGYVSSVQVEHTSVLKHAWGMHGLPPLNMRDAAANDLMDCIDVARLMSGDPRDPVPLPPVVVDESMLTDACVLSSYAPPGEITLAHAADLGVLPKWADRRHDARAQAEAVAENLARFKAGGIRRGW